MEINVLIPVIRWDLVTVLLNQINDNVILPSSVMLIHNCKQNVDLSSYKFDILNIVPKNNIGVNASWNKGINYYRNRGHLSILNDDIEIFPLFFAKVIKSFEKKEEVGVVCPNTVKIKSRFIKGRKNVQLKKMSKREGWAFSIRNTVLNVLPLIPKELKTFFGDDWIWKHTHWNNCFWYKDMSNLVFHHVGSSLIKIPNKRNSLNVERDIYGSLIERIKP